MGLRIRRILLSDGAPDVFKEKALIRIFSAELLQFPDISLQIRLKGAAFPSLQNRTYLRTVERRKTGVPMRADGE